MRIGAGKPPARTRFGRGRLSGAEMAYDLSFRLSTNLAPPCVPSVPVPEIVSDSHAAFINSTLVIFLDERPELLQ